MSKLCTSCELRPGSTYAPLDDEDDDELPPGGDAGGEGAAAYVKTVAALGVDVPPGAVTTTLAAPEPGGLIAVT
ncbi:MAG TPA: hypothetical protein VF407_06040, partial [Polyangiaceae bacterium]